LAVLFLLVIFKNRQNTDKTQRFVFWGFILFFAFSALKSHVEPHWIAISSVPLFVLLFKIAAENDKIRNLVRKFSIASIVILALGRFFLIFDILPIKTEFHGGKEYMLRIDSLAKSNPVIFMSGYDNTARYEFETKNRAHSRSSVHFRKSQYDIWGVDSAFYGKPALYISGYSFNFINQKVQISGKDSAFYYTFNQYLPILNLHAHFTDKPQLQKINTQLNAEFRIENGYGFDIQPNFKNMELNLQFVVFLPNDKKIFFPIAFSSELPPKIKSKSEIEITGHYELTGIEPGEYSAGIAVSNGKLFPKRPDEIFKISISK